MKRFSSLFLLSSLLGTALTTPLATHAATLSPGDLIKGPGDAVYYYANNGKRLVFPNGKTYATWYSNFDSVKTISLSELSAIPLGGNVTYRPGVKLVKITTDPKVYAVSSHGTLRWVTTEEIAKTLYGANWNTMVEDIADPFFINYTVGASITNASDFSPISETSAATDINKDKLATGTPAPQPTPTPTPPPTPTPTTTTSGTSIQLNVSKSTVVAGDVETVTVMAQDPAGIARIELYFDGSLIMNCDGTPSCVGDTPIPFSGTKESYEIKAVVKNLMQQETSKSTVVTVNKTSDNAVRVRVGQSQILTSQLASAIVNVDTSVAVNRVDILVDGGSIKACTNGARECQWADYLTGGVGTVHTVQGKVTDTIGRIYLSNTQTITISTTDSPSITVTPAKSFIYSGETLDVTVTASDMDGIASIDVMKDGAVLKHCDGSSPCTATTGPWTATGTSLLFSGRAVDTKGVSASTTASMTVKVTTP